MDGWICLKDLLESCKRVEQADPDFLIIFWKLPPNLKLDRQSTLQVRTMTALHLSVVASFFYLLSSSPMIYFH